MFAPLFSPQTMMWLLTLVKFNNTAQKWYASLSPEKKAEVSALAWKMFGKVIEQLVDVELDAVRSVFDTANA